MTTSKDTWIAIVIAVVVLALFFGTLFFYQGNDNETNIIMNDQANEAATTTVGTIDTRPNGLIVQDLVIGNGAEARAGNQVTVNYVGTLENGTVFDSSFNRNQPLTFTLGQGLVIPGWEEGIAGMKVGGNRKLIIPPALAYGAASAGNGAIPPNSTLIFEVTLLDVQ